MQISKKTRILILIVVDAIFFLLEIIIGYTAHSLALVADAFHMLNDIISLCVGYWATDVAENKESSSDYTYGWARAEILGGLVNGVFLIALCVTIVLDAIQRFFEIQEVSNPKLVLIVGGVGLVFNIMGLFLFHQHDHGPGDGHSHDTADELDSAETGHAGHSHAHGETHENGAAAKTVPKAKEDQKGVSFGGNDDTDETTPLMHQRQSSMSSRRRSTHRRIGSRTLDSSDNIPIHPASLRQHMGLQARMEESEASPEEEYEEEVEDNTKQPEIGENGAPIDHHAHKHALPKTKSGHGHTHDDNVRGMFLHVLGDALGNVGVMASALIIWLSSWKYRFYFDPIISLFITLIILKSAIPLVKDTARPLLQATPEDINVEHIREDIESLPGVESCHHIHVWALTRSKLIATLDVQLNFNFGSKEGVQRWMSLAKEIKSCLHGHNIHNSTVQPEFCLDERHRKGAGGSTTADGHADHDHHGNGSSSSSNHTVIPYAETGKADADGAAAGGKSSQPGALHHECGHGECLLADSCEGMACCGPAPGSGTATPKKSAGGGHDHAHDHDHDHGHGHSH